MGNEANSTSRELPEDRTAEENSDNTSIQRTAPENLHSTIDTLQGVNQTDSVNPLDERLTASSLRVYESRIDQNLNLTLSKQLDRALQSVTANGPVDRYLSSNSLSERHKVLTELVEKATGNGRATDSGAIGDLQDICFIESVCKLQETIGATDTESRRERFSALRQLVGLSLNQRGTGERAASEALTSVAQLGGDGLSAEFSAAQIDKICERQTLKSECFNLLTAIFSGNDERLRTEAVVSLNAHNRAQLYQGNAELSRLTQCANLSSVQQSGNSDQDIAHRMAAGLNELLNVGNDQEQLAHQSASCLKQIVKWDEDGRKYVGLATGAIDLEQLWNNRHSAARSESTRTLPDSSLEDSNTDTTVGITQDQSSVHDCPAADVLAEIERALFNESEQREENDSTNFNQDQPSSDEYGDERTPVATEPVQSNAPENATAGSTEQHNTDNPIDRLAIITQCGLRFSERGEMLEAQLPRGGQIILDRKGNVRELLDQSGRKTIFSYDEEGLSRVDKVLPDGNAISYTRQGSNQLANENFNWHVSDGSTWTGTFALTADFAVVAKGYFGQSEANNLDGSKDIMRADGRVAERLLPDGRRISLHYEGNLLEGSEIDFPDGTAHKLDGQSPARLLEIVNPDGRYARFNEAGLVTEFVASDNSVYKMHYQGTKLVGFEDEKGEWALKASTDGAEYFENTIDGRRFSGTVAATFEIDSRSGQVAVNYHVHEESSGASEIFGFYGGRTVQTATGGICQYDADGRLLSATNSTLLESYKFSWSNQTLAAITTPDGQRYIRGEKPDEWVGRSGKIWCQVNERTGAVHTRSDSGVETFWTTEHRSDVVDSRLIDTTTRDLREALNDSDLSRFELLLEGSTERQRTAIAEKYQTEYEGSIYDDIKTRFGPTFLEYGSSSDSNRLRAVNAMVKKGDGAADYTGALVVALAQYHEATISNAGPAKEIRSILLSRSHQELQRIRDEFSERLALAGQEPISLEEAVAKLSASDSGLCEILLKGTDKFAATDYLAISDDAITHQNLEQFLEIWSLAPVEARQAYLADDGENKTRKAFSDANTITSRAFGMFEWQRPLVARALSGKSGLNLDAGKAVDMLKLGFVGADKFIREASSYVFGDDENHIDFALRNMADYEHKLFRRGYDLFTKNADRTQLSEEDCLALNQFVKVRNALRTAGEPYEVQRWIEIGLRGGGLVTDLAGKKGVLGFDSSTHDLMHTIEAMSRDDFERLRLDQRYRDSVELVVNSFADGVVRDSSSEKARCISLLLSWIKVEADTSKMTEQDKARYQNGREVFYSQVDSSTLSQEDHSAINTFRSNEQNASALSGSELIQFERGRELEECLDFYRQQVYLAAQTNCRRSTLDVISDNVRWYGNSPDNILDRLQDMRPDEKHLYRLGTMVEQGKVSVEQLSEPEQLTYEEGLKFKKLLDRTLDEVLDRDNKLTGGLVYGAYQLRTDRSERDLARAILEQVVSGESTNISILSKLRHHADEYLPSRGDIAADVSEFFRDQPWMREVVNLSADAKMLRELYRNHALKNPDLVKRLNEASADNRLDDELAGMCKFAEKFRDALRRALCLEDPLGTLRKTLLTAELSPMDRLRLRALELSAPEPLDRQTGYAFIGIIGAVDREGVIKDISSFTQAERERLRDYLSPDKMQSLLQGKTADERMQLAQESASFQAIVSLLEKHEQEIVYNALKTGMQPEDWIRFQLGSDAARADGEAIVAILNELTDRQRVTSQLQERLGASVTDEVVTAAINEELTQLKRRFLTKYSMDLGDSLYTKLGGSYIDSLVQGKLFGEDWTTSRNLLNLQAETADDAVYNAQREFFKNYGLGSGIVDYLGYGASTAQGLNQLDRITAAQALERRGGAEFSVEQGREESLKLIEAALQMNESQTALADTAVDMVINIACLAASVPSLGSSLAVWATRIATKFPQAARLITAATVAAKWFKTASYAEQATALGLLGGGAKIATKTSLVDNYNSGTESLRDFLSGFIDMALNAEMPLGRLTGSATARTLEEVTNSFSDAAPFVRDYNTMLRDGLEELTEKTIKNGGTVDLQAIEKLAGRLVSPTASESQTISSRLTKMLAESLERNVSRELSLSNKLYRIAVSARQGLIEGVISELPYIDPEAGMQENFLTLSASAAGNSALNLTVSTGIESWDYFRRQQPSHSQHSQDADRFSPLAEHGAASAEPNPYRAESSPRSRSFEQSGDQFIPEPSLESTDLSSTWSHPNLESGSTFAGLHKAFLDGEKTVSHVDLRDALVGYGQDELRRSGYGDEALQIINDQSIVLEQYDGKSNDLGWYDPETDQMHIVVGRPYKDPMESPQSTFLHELTHRLQVIERTALQLRDPVGFRKALVDDVLRNIGHPEARAVFKERFFGLVDNVTISRSDLIHQPRLELDNEEVQAMQALLRQYLLAPQDGSLGKPASAADLGRWVSQHENWLQEHGLKFPDIESDRAIELIQEMKGEIEHAHHVLDSITLNPEAVKKNQSLTALLADEVASLNDVSSYDLTRKHMQNVSVDQTGRVAPEQMKDDNGEFIARSYYLFSVEEIRARRRQYTDSQRQLTDEIAQLVRNTPLADQNVTRIRQRLPELLNTNSELCLSLLPKLNEFDRNNRLIRFDSAMELVQEALIDLRAFDDPELRQMAERRVLSYRLETSDGRSVPGARVPGTEVYDTRELAKVRLDRAMKSLWENVPAKDAHTVAFNLYTRGLLSAEEVLAQAPDHVVGQAALGLVKANRLANQPELLMKLVDQEKAIRVAEELSKRYQFEQRPGSAQLPDGSAPMGIDSTGARAQAGSAEQWSGSDTIFGAPRGKITTTHRPFIPEDPGPPMRERIIEGFVNSNYFPGNLERDCLVEQLNWLSVSIPELIDEQRQNPLTDLMLELPEKHDSGIKSYIHGIITAEELERTTGIAIENPYRRLLDAVRKININRQDAGSWELEITAIGGSDTSWQRKGYGERLEHAQMKLNEIDAEKKFSTLLILEAVAVGENDRTFPSGVELNYWADYQQYVTRHTDPSPAIENPLEIKTDCMTATKKATELNPVLRETIINELRKLEKVDSEFFTKIAGEDVPDKLNRNLVPQIAVAPDLAISDVLTVIEKIDPELANRLSREKINIASKTQGLAQEGFSSLLVAEPEHAPIKVLMDHLRIAPEKFGPLDYTNLFHELVGHRAFEHWLRQQADGSDVLKQMTDHYQILNKLDPKQPAYQFAYHRHPIEIAAEIIGVEASIGKLSRRIDALTSAGEAIPDNLSDALLRYADYREELEKARELMTGSGSTLKEKLFSRFFERLDQYKEAIFADFTEPDKPSRLQAPAAPTPSAKLRSSSTIEQKLDTHQPEHNRPGALLSELSQSSLPISDVASQGPEQVHRSAAIQAELSHLDKRARQIVSTLGSSSAVTVDSESTFFGGVEKLKSLIEQEKLHGESTDAMIAMMSIIARHGKVLTPEAVDLLSGTENLTVLLSIPTDQSEQLSVLAEMLNRKVIDSKKAEQLLADPVKLGKFSSYVASHLESVTSQRRTAEQLNQFLLLDTDKQRQLSNLFNSPEISDTTWDALTRRLSGTSSGDKVLDDIFTTEVIERLTTGTQSQLRQLAVLAELISQHRTEAATVPIGLLRQLIELEPNSAVLLAKMMQDSRQESSHIEAIVSDLKKLDDPRAQFRLVTACEQLSKIDANRLGKVLSIADSRTHAPIAQLCLMARRAGMTDEALERITGKVTDWPALRDFCDALLLHPSAGCNELNLVQELTDMSVSDDELHYLQKAVTTGSLTGRQIHSIVSRLGEEKQTARKLLFQMAATGEVKDSELLVGLASDSDATDILLHLSAGKLNLEDYKHLCNLPQIHQDRVRLYLRAQVSPELPELTTEMLRSVLSDQDTALDSYLNATVTGDPEFAQLKRIAELEREKLVTQLELKGREFFTSRRDTAISDMELHQEDLGKKVSELCAEVRENLDCFVDRQLAALHVANENRDALNTFGMKSLGPADLNTLLEQLKWLNQQLDQEPPNPEVFDLVRAFPHFPLKLAAHMAGVRARIPEGNIQVYVHGSGRSALEPHVESQGRTLSPVNGLFKGKFFVTQEPLTAREFAWRYRLREIGGNQPNLGETPVLMGIALPADAVRALREANPRSPALRDKPIDDIPSRLETIFEGPEAYKILKEKGFFFWYGDNLSRREIIDGRITED